jgi:hypothetical protein
VDGVHRVALKAEDLRALETHNETGQALGRGGHFTDLDEEGVFASVGNHIFHLKVPSHRLYVDLLEEELLGLDIIYE